MKNIPNKELNKEFIKRQPYRRIGSCRSCNGKCCGFVIIPTFEGKVSKDINPKSADDYWIFHGAKKIIDKWLKGKYLMLEAPCKKMKNGRCMAFNKRTMPPQCAQFPVSPFDSVWRYLKQIGNPCGYEFIDKKTKKPWGMKRKEFPKKKGRKKNIQRLT